MDDFIKDNAYGITEQFRINDNTDYIAEEIQYQGFSVVKDVLSKEEIAKYLALTNEVYQEQVKEVGVENLRKINDENIVRAPLCYNKEFVKLAAHDVLLAVAKRVFENNFILIMQNGIINVPSNTNYQARWHRDLNYQHWTCTKTLSINALFCLTDFNEKTGGTYVLPGTHLNEKFPSEKYVRAHEICSNAPAGSLIIMNAMLYHRAGINSSDKARIGINQVLGLPFLSQPVNFSECFETDDEFLKKYLAFKWAPARSPKDWRMKRV